MTCVLTNESFNGQWMPFLKRFNEGQFLYLNEDPVWEMTIGHPPQHEERTLETLSCPMNPTPVT